MLPTRFGCIVKYGDLIEQNNFHIARQSQKGHLQEISTLAYSLCMALTNFIENMPVPISLERGLFGSGALYESCSTQ